MAVCVRAKPQTIAAAVITTKAQQMFTAVEQLKPRLTSKSTVFLICNGLLSVLPKVQALFSDSLSRPSIVVGTHISRRVSLGNLAGQRAAVETRRNWDIQLCHFTSCEPVVEMTLDRLNEVPRISPSGHVNLSASLSEAMSAFQSCPELHFTQKNIDEWAIGALLKLAVNCSVNAATTLLDQRNGSLLSPHALPYLREITLEVSSVLRAPGARAAIAAATQNSSFVTTNMMDALEPDRLLGTVPYRF